MSLPCPHCGLRFQRGHELKRHMKQHGPPEYHCEVCDAAFVRKDALTRHEKTMPASCNRRLARAKGPSSASPATRAASSSTYVPGERSPSPPTYIPTPEKPDSPMVPWLPKLPSSPAILCLLDIYSKSGWVQLPVLHMPTLRQRLMKLEVTNQTLVDYFACGLQPEAVQAVFWSVYRLLDGHQAEAEMWATACRNGLDEWAMELELEEDPLTSRASPGDLFAFVRASILALSPLVSCGLAADAARLRRLAVTAHRLAEFGTDHADCCVPIPETGTWKLARDPFDLAEWIDAEERARSSSWLLLWDHIAADLQGSRCDMRCGGYWTDAHGFIPGHYYSVPVPCPDMLFESLPPAPESEVQVRTWLAMMPECKTKFNPLPYGQVVGWPDLPLGSIERKRLLTMVYGRILENGYSRSSIVIGAALERLLYYRDFCRVRSYPLNTPPLGTSQDEVDARALRDKLALQFRDIFCSFPEVIRTADAVGDAGALRQMAIQHWGERCAFSLCQNMLNWHGAALTLYCPRDFAASLFSPDLAEEMEWTSTPLFMVASSHAIAASRLVCAASKSEDPASPSRPVSVLFPMMVLRAAWVRALCLRRVYGNSENAAGLFGSEHGTEGAFSSPEFVDRVLQDLRDCIDVIDRQGRVNFPADVQQSYIGMVRDVVMRLMSGEEVPSDEADLVRLLKNFRIER